LVGFATSRGDVRAPLFGTDGKVVSLTVVVIDDTLPTVAVMCKVATERPAACQPSSSVKKSVVTA